ncbi:unnamed protein product [Sphagnum jensenii]|uniref:Uncharacterized protein n=1 Tax=Sphagnum jensenii TaxID=128206 RepID=A0ABP0WYE5_9BRYO
MKLELLLSQQQLILDTSIPLGDEARLKTAIVSKVREHLPASQLLLEDFYLLLGLTTSGPEVPQAAIRKAYRVRALLCHPDKRGDDPVAAAEFVSLQRAYDVLGDEQARAAYDELLRLQKERLQKENHLSAKRQKMMQDLHDREDAHEIEKKAKVVEEQAAARLKVEIARIRKQRAQQQEKVPLFSDNRNLSVPSPGTAHHIDASDIDKTIKVTWACLEGGSGGYSAEQLKDIFKEFGEVEDIVIRQGKSRRKSSALLVMGSKEAAIAATQRPCGDISNPLLAVPATVTTGAASVTSEQLHPMAASQPTTRVSNGLVGASYRSFEDATLLKMRQIAATQRPCGDISNPLLAVPATVTTGAASVTSEQWHPMPASQPPTRVSNSLVAANYCSFEDATLLKMPQIAKEGSSAATASTDDKCSSYLNSMSVRNKYGPKYSQPFDVSEDCADSDLRSTLSNSTEFSDHTAATALGLSSQRSNFSKDQDSRNTPWKGLQYSDDQMKWIASIVPDQWKGCLHIHLGAYNTKEAAARAYDVGNYYTKKSFAFNISSPAAFLPPFPNNLSLDKAEDRIAIREFVQKEAKNFVAMIEKAEAPS